MPEKALSSNERSLPVVDTWYDLSLWVNQRSALEMLKLYLQTRSGGSALVRMPTGTGKTVVMAVLAHFSKLSATTLILAPWAQLVNQLSEEIGSDIWRKLGAQPRGGLRETVVFRSSTLRSSLNKLKTEYGILIGTYQSLQRVHAYDRSLYRDLQSQIGLVLVDEGHREPAPAWARAVRELVKPTVLFTATPYRNDRRLFDLNDKFRFVFTFHDAVSAHLIRNVDIVERKLSSDPQEYCKQLVAFTDGEFQRLKPTDVAEPRVIVRCDSYDEVIAIGSGLTSLKQSVIAIHERAPKKAPSWLLRRLPQKQQITAKYWIHQYKLVEGIDDPRFSLLAMYHAFPDTRALVQQIGRIIRNPSHAPHTTATVLTFEDDRQLSRWNRFLEFERSTAKPTGLKEIILSVIKSTSEARYLDRDFRGPFNPIGDDALKHLLFEKSAIVFGEITHSLNVITRLVQDSLVENDCIELRKPFRPDSRTAVILYGIAPTSELLSDAIFPEIRLGHVICHLTPYKHLVYADSEGFIPGSFAHKFKRLSPRELERAFQLRNLRIGQVTLLNSDLGPVSVRRRSIGTRSLGDTAPGLGDHAQFCTTASGSFSDSSGRRVRRYVGFARARITEQSQVNVDLAAFCKWADELSCELSRPRKSVRIFDRYAEYLDRPRSRIPTHILFDLSAFDEVEGRDNGFIIPVELEELAAEISSDGSFSISIGTNDADCTIGWSERNARYEIKSSVLDSFWIPETRGRRGTVLGYLNLEQAFRLITATGEAYYGRRYYKPRVPIWGSRRSGKIELLNTLIGSNRLAKIRTEKGVAGSAQGPGWSSTSLFGYIDSKAFWKDLRLQEPDILVCDDLGNELADFIAVRRSPPWLALIHAKCADKPSQVSAGALHEVYAQATKNLAVINPAQESPIKNADLWNGNWSGGKIGTVDARIRKAPMGWKAREIMNLIHETALNPLADRRVVALVARTLSRRALAGLLKSDQPQPHVIQTAYLLQSLWNATSQLGGRLMVVCDQ